MYSYLTFALSFVASASALVVPRATAPKGWDTAALEPYDTYHKRYMALQCQAKHDTKFFDQCCHPLLAKESLKNRPAQCTPATDDEDDLEDCDDDQDSTPATSKAAPTPVTHKTAPAAATPSAKAAAADATNSGGFATFFYQNNNAGACGTVHSDTDYVAAIDYRRYGYTGKRSSLCGKKVKITNAKSGKSVTVTVADACPTCVNSNSIDLSVGAFKQIATLDQGIVPITWAFV